MFALPENDAPPGTGVGVTVGDGFTVGEGVTDGFGVTVGFAVGVGVEAADFTFRVYCSVLDTLLSDTDFAVTVNGCEPVAVPAAGVICTVKDTAAFAPTDPPEYPAMVYQDCGKPLTEIVYESAELPLLASIMPWLRVVPGVT